jgi:hypothetical protein
MRGLVVLVLCFGLLGCSDDGDDKSILPTAASVAAEAEACPIGKVLCQPYDGVGIARCFNLAPGAFDGVRPILCEAEDGSCLYGCPRH